MAERMKGFIAFPKGISQKENAITRLKFEPVYYDVIVLRVSHYARKTPPLSVQYMICKVVVQSRIYGAPSETQIHS